MRWWGLMRACSSCPHALGHDLLAASLETETRFATLQLRVWVETLRGGRDGDGVGSNLNCSSDSLAARPNAAAAEQQKTESDPYWVRRRDLERAYLGTPFLCILENKDLICCHTPSSNWMLLRNCCFWRCQVHYTHVHTQLRLLSRTNTALVLFFLSKKPDEHPVPPWAEFFRPACLNRKYPCFPLPHSRFFF